MLMNAYQVYLRALLRDVEYHSSTADVGATFPVAVNEYNTLLRNASCLPSWIAQVGSLIAYTWHMFKMYERGPILMSVPGQSHYFESWKAHHILWTTMFTMERTHSH